MIDEQIKNLKTTAKEFENRAEAFQEEIDLCTEVKKAENDPKDKNFPDIPPKDHRQVNEDEETGQDPVPKTDDSGEEVKEDFEICFE